MRKELEFGVFISLYQLSIICHHLSHIGHTWLESIHFTGVNTLK